MADDDDEFLVKLGRIGNRRSRRVVRYAKRIVRAAATAGPQHAGRASAFTGARIGRGRAEGSILAIRGSLAGRRRVVIKTRIVRIRGGDLGAARAHLRYIQRDGVTPQGNPGELYDAGSDATEGKTFLERSSADRHQFRFIVSAEDGVELTDLKPFVRDLMRQMEQDLGTKLDWVAADHFNTGFPHTHILLRGRDEHGKDLVIARDYIAHGMRARASDLVTRELGPETELETLRKLERDVGGERFTRIDRAILRDAGNGLLTLAARSERDPNRHAIRMGRLQRLHRMGLAEEIAPGTWRIDPKLEPTLRRMGERGDIIKTMHRDLRAAGFARGAADYSIFDTSVSGARLTGRIVGDGFSDELQDRRYLVVDGVDGRPHYVDIGVRSANDEPLVRNMIVELRARDVEPRTVDRVIAAVANRHGGIYSADLHRAADPRAAREFIASHVRRLEALRRQGLVKRLGDDRWGVGTDYLDRATRFEMANRTTSPVRATVLSWQTLEELPEAMGATWLDRQLVATTRDISATGFGAQVNAALNRRRQWLLDQGFARSELGAVIYPRNLIGTLRRRELVQAAALISERTGLGYTEVRKGEEVRGTYRRALKLASGRFALIERAHDFTLVPWRPVLERAKGQVVVGSVGGEGISWSIGIRRGLGR